MTFQLPPERSKLGLPDQGWLVESQVAPSRIADSGNGRYAKQVIPAGTRVLVKKLVAMDTIEKLSELPGINDQKIAQLLIYAQQVTRVSIKYHILFYVRRYSCYIFFGGRP